MTCRVCKEDRASGEFREKHYPYVATRPRPRLGYFTLCKSCESLKNKAYFATETAEQRTNRLAKARTWWFRSKYGITEAEYDQMVDIQGGLCACCNLAPSGKGAAAVLNVDHDHVTGRVRGLLCNPCNQAMGLMKDNPAMVRQLLAYADYAAELRAVA
jgi:hypothetical protein